MTDDEAIARHIVPDPQKSGRAYTRVQPSQVSVWVIASALSRGDTPDQIASDYDLLPKEMQAATAYYRRHQDLFDAFLLLERDAWEATVPKVVGVPLYGNHNFARPAVELLKGLGYDVVASRELPTIGHSKTSCCSTPRGPGAFSSPTTATTSSSCMTHGDAGPSHGTSSGAMRES